VRETPDIASLIRATVGEPPDALVTIGDQNDRRLHVDRFTRAFVDGDAPGPARTLGRDHETVDWPLSATVRRASDALSAIEATPSELFQRHETKPVAPAIVIFRLRAKTSC
jgi:hypothetical protein